MAGFSFGNINVSSKKKVVNLETISDCIAYDCSDNQASKFPINILLDEYYDEGTMKIFRDFFESNRVVRYRMLFSLNCKIRKEDIQKDQKEGIIDFYTNNRSSFETKLIPHAPIVTVGAALYALLQENDIQPNHVQQRIFGKPHFWFSKTLKSEDCHMVFPIESFYDIYADGFKNGPVDSFKTKLAKEQLKDCLKASNYKVPSYAPLKKIFISTKEEFISRFYLPNEARRGDIVAWDLETSGFSFLKDTIGCITLSFDGKTGYYVPWRIMDDECKSLLNEILGNNRQCFANGKFDVKFLWANGVPNAKVDEDVITLGHILDETRSNSLKSLAFYYSEYGGYERDLDIYKKKTGVTNYLQIDEKTLREYAIMDAIVTRRVFDNLFKHMRELDEQYSTQAYGLNNMERFYYDRCIPAGNMYAKLEYRGFYVSKSKLDALRKVMNDYIRDCKHQLSEIFGKPLSFEWGSGVQLGTLLEEKGWENLGRSKLIKLNTPKDKMKDESSRVYLTSDFQLKRWEKDHPKEVGLIKDLKHAQTLLNSFVGSDIIDPNSDKQPPKPKKEFSFNRDDEISESNDDEKGWSQYMVYHPEDNSWRMHASYFSMGTDSGRTRCQKPNLQNTPTRGMFAKDIKKCVCTPDDDNYYLVTIDYSSLQMRLATIDQYPPDKNLFEAFWTPHIDMHSRTAFLSFCQEKEFDVEIITVEQDGKTYTFLGGETVLTKERGEIFAKDLTEEDTLDIE